MKYYDNYYMQLVTKQQLKEQTFCCKEPVPGYFFEFQLRVTIKLVMKEKLWAFKLLKWLSDICKHSILAGKKIC